ncbi:hypothetical protein D3C85_1509770 [compost metagenome]
MPGQLDGSIKQHIWSNHFVDVSYFERLLRRHRPTFKHQHQRAMGADQSWQSLSASATGKDSKKHLGLPDEEIAIRHQADVTR